MYCMVRVFQWLCSKVSVFHQQTNPEENFFFIHTVWVIIYLLYSAFNPMYSTVHTVPMFAVYDLPTILMYCTASVEMNVPFHCQYNTASCTVFVWSMYP